MQRLLESYFLLKDILGGDNKHSSYDKIKEKYGDQIADMWDQVPNDPQCDYQFKCYIDSIKLYYHDNSGAKWEARINK